MEMVEVKTVEAPDGQGSPRVVIMPGSLVWLLLAAPSPEQQGHQTPPSVAGPQDP